MSSKGTPHRPIRISNDLWAKAQAKAAQEGTTASEVVRKMLTAWVEDSALRDGGAEPNHAPPPGLTSPA